MDTKTLHTRLIALLAGVAVAVCAIVGVTIALPAQATVDDKVDYGYVYSGTKSSSVAFAKAAMTDESLLMFGSSEFSTPAKLVPQIPAVVFGEHDYGLRCMLIGEAFDQSLWHAIAFGAFAQGGVPRNKVVFLVGPGWFVDGGMDGSTFQTRFSYSLYSAFCANESIPDEVKEYVRSRLESYGIDETQLAAANGSLPQDVLNNTALSFIDDLKLRQGLREVREAGIPLAAGAEDPATHETPDFEALHKQAVADGEARCTTNDWGVEDDFYTNRLEPVLADAKDSRTDETYTDTPEYDDMDCFLDIADACGIEVLVVVSPVMGPYYDHLGITADVRVSCYDRMREIAGEHECATVADFSDREYEKHFLFDIVHFGTVGWTDVNQAIYNFAMEEE